MFNTPKSTTPTEITAAIAGFCKSVEPSETPIFVPVRPQRGCQHAECVLNLALWIPKHGGKEQQGWTIWYIHNTYVEGEYHSIWIDPQGNPIDITPKRDGETSILFLPSHKRVYKVGELLPDARRLPLVRSIETARLIKIGQGMYAIRKRHFGKGISHVPMMKAEMAELRKRVLAGDKASTIASNRNDQKGKKAR